MLLKIVLVSALLPVSYLFANGVPKVIRLGWVGNKFDKPFTGGIVGYAQQTKAWEKEFEKDGITIEWNFFKGTGPAINEALANGKIDFASSGDLPSTAGKANGLPTRVIVGSGGRGSKRFVLVAANSTITKPEDLIGKRITFQKGTYAHLMWNRYARDVLKKNGEKDFKIYSLTGGDQDVALASGSVDAIFPGSLDLVYRKTARVIDTIYEDKYPILLTNYNSTYTTQKFIDQYPDIVYRWVKVYLKLADELYQEKNRDYIFQLGTLSGSSLKSVTEANFDKGDLRFSNLPIMDDFYKKQVEKAIEDEVTFKLIRKPFSVDAWWDRSFYDRALKELGLDTKWADVIAKRASVTNK
jgi:sulfonate transport system substrate-binding protein